MESSLVFPLLLPPCFSLWVICDSTFLVHLVWYRFKRCSAFLRRALDLFLEAVCHFVQRLYRRTKANLNSFGIYDRLKGYAGSIRVILTGKHMCEAFLQYSHLIPLVVTQQPSLKFNIRFEHRKQQLLVFGTI